METVKPTKEQLLSELEDVVNVIDFSLDFKDGISLLIEGATPQLARDYLKYQTDANGLRYAPSYHDKLQLAQWFKLRKCKVKFIANSKVKLRWWEQLQVGWVLGRLNAKG